MNTRLADWLKRHEADLRILRGASLSVVIGGVVVGGLWLAAQGADVVWHRIAKAHYETLIHGTGSPLGADNLERLENLAFTEGAEVNIVIHCDPQAPTLGQWHDQLIAAVQQMLKGKGRGPLDYDSVRALRSNMTNGYVNATDIAFMFAADSSRCKESREDMYKELDNLPNFELH